MFLTNDTTLNENEVTLAHTLLFNISWNKQVSKQDIIKEDFLISLLEKEFSGPD